MYDCWIWLEKKTTRDIFLEFQERCRTAPFQGRAALNSLKFGAARRQNDAARHQTLQAEGDFNCFEMRVWGLT